MFEDNVFYVNNINKKALCEKKVEDIRRYRYNIKVKAEKLIIISLIRIVYVIIKKKEKKGKSFSLFLGVFLFTFFIKIYIYIYKKTFNKKRLTSVLSLTFTIKYIYFLNNKH